MSKTTIHGIHAVQTAIENDAGNIIRLYVDTHKQTKRLTQLLSEAKKRGLKAEYADSKQLDKIAKTNKHQSVVAEYKVTTQYSENDLFDLLTKLNETPLLLVLDGVTDPHNLGACLRTSEATGVHAVIIPKDKSVGLTPTVRKVASGAAELVPLIQVTNLARTLQDLKDAGLWIIGTSDKASHDVFDQDFTLPAAIVMGAEGAGIRRLTEKQCDMLIRLPMAGKISSLNISVATGVCLYEAIRQRRE
jgi:23S rRNA (guanosine2251-2'-O)-methyltransferase